MQVRRILKVLLFAILPACGARGCGVGETVTLIYGGTAPITARTQVMIGKESIGFVDTVAPDAEGQRIVMRLREAALLHEEDGYLPLQDLDGKIGLEVQPGGGKPLVNGALIYFPKRVNVPIAAEAKHEPRDYTPLTPEPGAPPEDAAPGTVVSWKEDTYARRSIRRAIAEVLEQTDWPEPVKAKADEVYARARRPGNEMALLAEVRHDLPALHRALPDVAQQAYHKGDEAKAREALKAIQRVVMLENRVSAIQERGGAPTPHVPGAAQ